MEKLNSSQKAAFDFALKGHSFVLLGSAGTGKSYVVSQIVENLRRLGKKVALTCSTGIACLVYDRHLKAQTVHSFTGIGDGRYSVEEVRDVVLNSPKHQNVLKQVQETDTLLIDECSMISGRTLELIAEVLSLRNPSLLFGGVQVILCGDFKQLPPVRDLHSGDDGLYCFETQVFQKGLPHIIELTDIVRQTNEEFVKAIHEVSNGDVSVQTSNLLKSTSQQDFGDDGIWLFAKNDLVDDFNRKKILERPGQLYEFKSLDEGEQVNQLSKLIVPSKLWLKKGIRVILLRNLHSRLVNGLRGTVVDVDEDGPTVKFEDTATQKIEKSIFEVYSSSARKVVATRIQFPLKPAFGLTIHKAQGMTLDRVSIDCRDIFQPGQLGVALSRVRTIEGLCVKNFDEKFCLKHPAKVTEFYNLKTVEDLEDCSCCRNIKRNQSDVRPDETDNLLFTPDDKAPEQNTDDAFDEEFDQVLREINFGTDEFHLPEDFHCKSVIETIKVDEPVSRAQKRTNEILLNVTSSKIETFCKKEFLVLTNIVNDLNITVPRAVSSKELTQFYTKVNEHIISLQYKLSCIALFEGLGETFSDDHMRICFGLHLAVRKYLMKQKTNLLPYESQHTTKRFVTDASRPRIKYVGGYCVAKLLHNYSKKKANHRFNISKNSQSIYTECDFLVTLLNFMRDKEDTIKSQVMDQDTLKDIERRQSATRGLTYITDDIFNFFVKLSEECMKLLQSAQLNQFGETMFNHCYDLLTQNSTLKVDFRQKLQEKINESKLDSTTVHQLKTSHLLREQFIMKVFEKIVKKFLMVMFSQYTKDLKSSFHVEKTMAHRKQILIKRKKTTDASKKASKEPEPSTSGIRPRTESSIEKKSEKSGQGRKGKGKRKLKSYVDESGEMVWICPSCLEPEDGINNMIGCDKCEEWFHWACVDISSEPKEETWFCPGCDSVSKGKQIRKNKRN